MIDMILILIHIVIVHYNYIAILSYHNFNYGRFL